MSETKQSQRHVAVATRDGLKITKAKPKHHSRVLEEPDDVLKEQVGGFTNFLREYAVVGLAVGFILGQQANAVAKQLATSFIQPWLQVLFGKDFSDWTYVAHHGTQKIDVAWGQFVYTFIEFLFVAITIYVVVRLLRLDKLKKLKEGEGKKK